MIYVTAEEFNEKCGALPPVGRELYLDGKQYLVSDAQDEYGIYSISLGSNET